MSFEIDCSECTDTLSSGDRCYCEKCYKNLEVKIKIMENQTSRDITEIVKLENEIDKLNKLLKEEQ